MSDILSGDPRLDRILERVEKAKKEREGYGGLCPSHDDSDASLSLTIGDDGRILLHCFAGCPFDSICAALHVNPADLGPPNGNGSHGHATLNGNGKREPVEIYDYPDENGRLVRQKLRYEPKSFSQRAPDGNGGWIWKLKGVRDVLFRLPDLLKADPSLPIYIVEGEKDANNLWRMGLPATTNIEGAAKADQQSKWKPEYTAWLKEHLPDRSFVLIPDNDESGRGQSQSTLASLKAAGLRAVILNLPDLPEKGDVTDWRDAGGTKKQLLDLANDLLKPPEARFPFITLAQLRQLPPPKYQVDDFFLEQSMTQTYGETNHGKSLVRFDLSCSICQGRETWFGRKINRYGPVIWINADGGRGLTLRANAWAEAHGGEMKYPLYILMGSVNLTVAQQVDAFRRQILEMDERPVLIEFDTQSRCMPGGRENDQDEMTRLTDGLHRLKNEVGCTVDLIHHADKAGRWARGSGVVHNESDTQMLVCKDEDSGIFTVVCKKGRDHPVFDDFHFKVKPTLDSVIVVQHDQAPPRAAKEAKADHRHELALLIVSSPGITYDEAAEQLSISRKTILRYAGELEDLKVIVRRPRPLPEGAGGRPETGLYPSDPGTDRRLCDS